MSQSPSQFDVSSFDNLKLRGRDRWSQRPIIVKFISHKSEVLFMRNKKKLKETDYNMTEDLAPEVYTRLKQIRNLPSINKCWSVDGKIKYVMNEESIVRKMEDGKSHKQSRPIQRTKWIVSLINKIILQRIKNVKSSENDKQELFTRKKSGETRSKRALDYFRMPKL